MKSLLSLPTLLAAALLSVVVVITRPLVSPINVEAETPLFVAVTVML